MHIGPNVHYLCSTQQQQPDAVPKVQGRGALENEPYTVLVLPKGSGFSVAHAHNSHPELLATRNNEIVSGLEV